MSPRQPHRFFHPEPIVTPAVLLTAEESHHVIRVLRLRPGTQVEVFDASGKAFFGEVGGIQDGRVEVARLVSMAPEGEQAPEAELGLAVACLKHRAMDLLIEKLSELGVARLQPLVAARCVVRGEGSAETGGQVPARWERIAIAAAKQSGRNTPLELLAPMPLKNWLALPGQPAAHAAFAHFGAGAAPITRWLAERAGATLPLWVAIGPEGGWTAEECDGFERAGFKPVTLGGLVLRAETAAIAAAAVCQMTIAEKG